MASQIPDGAVAAEGPRLETETPADGDRGDPATPSVPPDRSTVDPNDLAGLLATAEQRARLAEDRLAEVLTAYRQIKVDSDGVAERAARNLERRFESRRERLLLRFIDILDNLDRALDAAQTAYADPSLLHGLILVRTQLLQRLQEEGLERVPVLGLPFDPHVSEAVGTEPVDDPDQDGIAIKESTRGYRLNGRMARHSQVVIAEYVAPPVEVVAAPPIAGTTAGAAARPDGAGPLPAGETPRPAQDVSLDEIIARAEALESGEPVHTPDHAVIEPLPDDDAELDGASEPTLRPGSSPDDPEDP